MNPIRVSFAVLLAIPVFASAMLGQITKTERIPCCYPIVGEGNHRLGYVDAKGRMIIRPVYDVDPGGLEALVHDHGFSEGRAVVKSPQDLERWDFINEAGEPTGSLKADLVLPFSEGLAAYVTESRTLPRWGFVDREGRTIIEPRFVMVRKFSGGLAAVTDDGKNWGFIDKTGGYRIKPHYAGAFDFGQDWAAVRGADNRLAFIDKSDASVLTTSYEFRIFDDSIIDSYIKRLNRQNQKEYGSDEDVSFTENANARLFETPRFSEGLFPVKVGKAWRYLDKGGRLKKFRSYGAAGNFHDGIARVKVGGAYGYINPFGKTVIDPAYAYGGDFVNGLALVIYRFAPRILSGRAPNGGDYENGSRRITAEYGYINPAGKTVIRSVHKYDAAIFGGDLSAGFSFILRAETDVTIRSQPPASTVYFVPSTDAKGFNYDDTNALNVCCWFGVTNSDGTVTASRPVMNYLVVIMNEGKRSSPVKIVLNEDPAKNNFLVKLN